MRRTLIMAFVGAGNLGDEAILAGTLKRWRDRGYPDPIVFSWQPAETAQTHSVLALPVIGGLRGLLHFARALQRGDLLVLGGGSLLQDGERRIVPFWLSRALIARLLGCRVVYHAQGVGPLRTTLGRILVRLVVPLTAHAITVRDEGSMKLVSAARPVLVADPALLLPALERRSVPGRVVVALRSVQGAGRREAALLQVLRLLKEKLGLEYVFVAMHYPDDVAMATDFAAATEGTVLARPSLGELRELLAGAELVLAMRLHAAILAAGVLTPVIGLAYDPKVLAFFASIGLKALVFPWGEHFSPAEFDQVVAKAYAERSGHREHLKTTIPLAVERAARAVDLVLEWGK
ncbi:MAG: hypothetical protein DDT34_01673 [Firmicutes bacterium]|nr:hypothetical protein [Bacillota bacterium]